MRVTVSHTQPVHEVVQAVDRSFDDLFRGMAGFSLQITNEQRRWDGQVMTFSFRAKMGLLSTPIKGTVEVTSRDITVDADLGIFEKLLPQKQAQTALEASFHKLLK